MMHNQASQQTAGRQVALMAAGQRYICATAVRCKPSSGNVVVDGPTGCDTCTMITLSSQLSEKPFRQLRLTRQTCQTTREGSECENELRGATLKRQSAADQMSLFKVAINA